MMTQRKFSVGLAGLCLAVLVLGVPGCGATGAGVYVAQLRQVGDVRPELWARVDSENKAAPEQLTLRGDGSFTLLRGAEEIWRGRWRMEGDNLVLRATRVKGVEVQGSLQDDVSFEKREGGGFTDSRTRGDGYVRDYVLSS